MDNQTQQNTPPIQSPTQTPISSSTNWSKKLFFIILGLIVVAGSVFAGIQIGKSQITKQQPITEKLTISPTQTVVNQVIVPTTTLTIEPNPTTNPTANWKTYISSNNLFTFKYPTDGDWKVDESDAPLGKFISAMCQNCSSSNNIDLFQIAPVIFKSLEEYIEKDNIKTDFIRTNINGIEVIKAAEPGGPQAGGSAIHIFFVKNSQGYILTQRFLGLLDKTKLTDFPEPNPNILSTFKFIN